VLRNVPVPQWKHKKIEPVQRHDADCLNRDGGNGEACVLTREPGIKLREKVVESPQGICFVGSPKAISPAR
jgi:hypothetical protein